MLPQRHRLRRTTDIRRVRQRGRSWRHPLAILLVIENDQNESRFAFAASRGVGKAVARNRARRLLRAAARRYLDGVHPGYDCLFVARAATPGAGGAAVEAAVGQLLRRAQLWSGAPGGETA